MGRPKFIPLSNLPSQAEDTSSLPSASQLEVFRLRRKLATREGQLQQLSQQLLRARKVLLEQQHLWEAGLHKDLWPTVGEALVVLTRIRSSLSFEGIFKYPDEFGQKLEAKWKYKKEG